MFGFFKKKQKPELKPRVYSYRSAAERLEGSSLQPLTRKEPAMIAKSSDEDFGLSMAVGMATDNALLGYAAGGSLIGGMLGAEMSESSSRSEPVSTSCETSNNVDSGSFVDSGSSFDSGSFSGSDSGSW